MTSDSVEPFNMKNRLDTTFNIAPSEVVVDKPETVGIQKPPRLTQDDITKDYEYTRGNLYSIIEKGKKQLMEFLNLLKKVKCLEPMKWQGS